MPLIHAVVLALIQALTEFLPISSTAHLILFPWLLHWPEPGLAFDVALHAGTLVAILLYFFRVWWTFLLCGLGRHYPATAGEAQVAQSRRMFWYMALGTVPAGLVGWFFHRQIEENLRRPLIIGLALVAVAILMWLAEAKASLRRSLEDSNLGDALTIGTAQAVALLPGVSRSGITITTGLFRGMTRDAATRFSFILSAPVIAGAVAKELPQLIKLHRAGGLELPLSTLALSIAVSGLAGYLVIAMFLRYLRTRTLKVFVVYRLLFGIVILVLAFLRIPAR